MTHDSPIPSFPMSSPNLDLFPDTPAAPAGPRLVPAAAAGAAPRAARELWLCLWLPSLPLEALGERATGPAACAVIEGEGSRQWVAAASEAARRQGIRPGLGLNAALALVPGLDLRERRPDAEAALLQRIAGWAIRFTPVVSLEPPAALLAEVRGSLGLFGGAEALRRRAAGELQECGLVARASIAPTPRAAWWLARAAREEAVQSLDALPSLAARLPVACLGWPPEAMRTLVTLGVRTIADLARLPREGIARRFGPALLDELDEGFGRRPQPRRRAVNPERFDETLELPAESESLALVEAALSRLLERLQAFLRARAAGIRGLALELRHRDVQATRLRLGLARPTGDVAHLLGLLRERLERTPLPAPARALRLRSTIATPLVLASGALPGEGAQRVDSEAAARLVERLRARLGAEAVFSVCLVPEHRPESAWRVAEPDVASPVAAGHPRRRRSLQKKGQPPAPEEKGTVPFSSRPLWMLAEPQRLLQQDGVPLHEGRLLELGSGPERIETGWWDGRDVRRDYYIARARSGLRLWVFRERDRDGGWWLHGVFG